MFGLGPATKIYICLDAVDMRKGFDGLYGLVRDHLGQDPQSGHLFLFANRSHTRSISSSRSMNTQPSLFERDRPTVVFPAPMKPIR